jgi:hypothetical protein
MSRIRMSRMRGRGREAGPADLEHGPAWRPQGRCCKSTRYTHVGQPQAVAGRQSCTHSPDSQPIPTSPTWGLVALLLFCHPVIDTESVESVLGGW